MVDETINVRYNLLTGNLETGLEKMLILMGALETRAKRTSQQLKSLAAAGGTSGNSIFGAALNVDLRNLPGYKLSQSLKLAEVNSIKAKKSMDLFYASLFPKRSTAAAFTPFETLYKNIAKATLQMQLFKLQARQMQLLGPMFGLLFGGMQAQRFGQSIIRFVLPSMEKLGNFVSKGTKKVQAMNASFQFLKFSMFEAFSNSALFKAFVDLTIQFVNWVSELVAKHPILVDILAIFGAILFTLGTLAIPAGFIIQIVSLGVSMKALALAAELAALETGKIKSKSVTVTFLGKGLDAMVAAYKSLKSKTIVAAANGLANAQFNAQSGLSAVGKASQGLLQGIGFALGAMLGKVPWAQLGTKAGGLFATGLRVAGPQILFTLIGGGFSKFNETLNTFLDKLGIAGDFIRIIGNVIGVAFNFAQIAIKNIIQVVIDLFTKPLELLRTFIGWLNQWGQVFAFWGNQIATFVTGIFQKLFELLPNWLQTAITWIGNLITKVADFFKSIYDWTVAKLQPLFDWFTGAFKVIGDVVGKVWDFVTGATDKAADATQKLNADTRQFSLTTDTTKSTTEDTTLALSDMALATTAVGDEIGYSNINLTEFNSSMGDAVIANDGYITSSGLLVTQMGTEQAKVDSLTKAYKRLAAAKREAGSPSKIDSKSLEVGGVSGTKSKLFVNAGKGET